MVTFVFGILALAIILTIAMSILRALIWIHIHDPEGYTFGTIAFIVACLIWPLPMTGVVGAALVLGAIFYAWKGIERFLDKHRTPPHP